MPKYNSQTLRALDDAIAHWKRLSTNSQTPGEAPDWQNCALCRRFIDFGCEGCPVRDATKQTGCRGTPYRYAMAEWSFSSNRPREDFFRQALLMLNFLITLRKEILQ